MSCRIAWADAASRSFRKLPKPQQQRLAKAVDGLQAEPRPSGVEKLKAEENLYRIRVGDYRIVYQIQDQELLVLILRVGDRKDIYR